VLSAHWEVSSSRILRNSFPAINIGGTLNTNAEIASVYCIFQAGATTEPFLLCTNRGELAGRQFADLSCM
jgi:hypothetical protein